MPHIPVDLICIDTTRKSHLAVRAIDMCLAQASFNSVKLLTNKPHRYAVAIPEIRGVEHYSNFVCRDLHRYVTSSHCLLIQSDGYVLNAPAWRLDFLNEDYIGAPWLQWNLVGNGGFSLRSKKLLQFLSTFKPGENCHPEDSWICYRHRNELQSSGIKIANTSLGSAFAFEGRSFNGKDWSGTPTKWAGQFGFHSWLTPLPENSDRPVIFHHSGDMGDVIYSLAAARAAGGGVYFFSPECLYPFPTSPRICQTNDWGNWCGQIIPLLEHQDYIWKAAYTNGTPFSTDVDFNAFRSFYRSRNPDNFASLFSLHLKRFGLDWPEDKPWLRVDDPCRDDEHPIVVNRTPRFHNDAFPWYDLVQKYGHLMTFIGSPSEAQNFQGMALPTLKGIHYTPTANLLDAARVIAGAKVFIGNQSCPMAIALGLGVNVIQEVWLENPNCRLKRDNALYWTGGPLDIPKGWL